MLHHDDSRVAVVVHGGPDLEEPRVFEIESPADRILFYGILTRAGDFDGDGYADVAFGCYTRDHQQRATCVYFGQREGTLDLGFCLTPPTPPGPPIKHFGQDLASGDLDGDGHSDIVVSFRQCAVDHLAVYRGGGERRNRAPTMVLRHPESELIAELDQEACNGAGRSVEQEEFDWAMGAPQESTEPEYGFGYGGYSDSNCLHTGDINGDGFDDLLVGAPHFASLHLGVNRSRILVFSGARSGPGENPSLVLPRNEGAGLALELSERDIDGDGIADVVARDDEGVHVRWGHPSEPLRERAYVPTPWTEQLLAIDTHGTGRPRLVRGCNPDEECMIETYAVSPDDERPDAHRLLPPRARRRLGQCSDSPFTL